MTDLTDEELFSKVSITDNGAVCLGDSLVCDGYEKNRHATVFTHIHSDHVSDDFGTCMHHYPVYTSKSTGELLEAITGESYRRRTQFHQIPFEKPEMIKFNGKGDLLTLLESKHMLGSSMVFLQTHDKLKIAYSGDISPLDTPPKCDILVIDSTHGDPRFDKIIDGESLERRLVEIVVDAIDNGKPVCIHAHRGRLQHIMHLLSVDSDIPDSVHFLSDKTDLTVASIYNKTGIKIRSIINFDSYEARTITTGNYPWIEFRTNALKTPQENRGQVRRIVLMGGFGKAVMKHNGEDYWMATDDHAEFSALLKYVKNAEPRVVVTDNSRSKFGPILAEKINEELGINAKSMP